MVTKELACFDDIQNCLPEDRVSFVANLLDLRELIGTGDFGNRVQYTVFDGKKTCYFTTFGEYKEAIEKLCPNTVYKFEGTISGGSKKKYFKLDTVLNVNIDSDIVKRLKPQEYQRLLEGNYHYFVSAIDFIQDPSYKRYVEILYGMGQVPETVREASYRKRSTYYRSSPGSINYHDNYPGGYINHVVGILRVLRSVQEIYGSYGIQMPVGRIEGGSVLRWDYLYALTFFHDAGKPYTYRAGQFPGRFEWKQSTHLDHNVQGVLRLQAVSSEVEHDLKLTDDSLQELYYGILCHSNPTSASYVPKSPEDQLFASLDKVDSICVTSLQL